MRELESVSMASRRLRVHPSRIRALLRSGALRGRKVGGRWLVDARDDRGGSFVGAGGRPLDIKNAWAHIFVASGLRPKWVSRFELSRARRRLREVGLLQLAARLRTRARVEHFSADGRRVGALKSSQRLVFSGASAASHYGADIRWASGLDAYIPEGALRALVYQFALREADPQTANVVLRAVRELWPFESGISSAPLAAVVLDLYESHDPRSKRAAATLARRLVEP
jgi:hypothetical protein